MALDKQKILNELGNVVNQLQSAECGCMGKLFANSGPSNPNVTPMSGPCGGGAMRGCYGHGCNAYNSPCAGEPCAGARNCMGFCNPPKLYADTYSYLNQNLMQPVVKEVYDDLKSISPTNTIMNSPMGAQMGLSQANNPNQGNMMVANSMPIGGSMGGPMGNESSMSNMGQKNMPHLHFGNVDMNAGSASNGQMNNLNMQQEMGQGMGQMGQGMGQMGQGVGQPGQALRPTGGMIAGMGPQIVNMMSNSARNNMSNQGGPPVNGTGDNMTLSQGMGQMQSNKPDITQGQFNSGQMHDNAGYMGMNNMPQGNRGMQRTQYMSQPNTFLGATTNAQNAGMPGNINQMNAAPQRPQVGNMNHLSADPQQPQMNQMVTSPQQMGNMNQMVTAPQQMGNMNTNPQQINKPNAYGQHSAGLTKFSEMFPGVMKGDLGFDPMAIAIQMNPANQQQSAMDTMTKMMMNNSSGISKILDATGKPSPVMQPVVNATNAASASIAQPNQPPTTQAPAGQQNIVSAPVHEQQQPATITGGVPIQNNQIPQQQVYTALTGAPTIHQQLQPQQLQAQQSLQQLQQPRGQTQQQYQPPQQQMIDPRTGAIVSGGLPTVYEGAGDPNTRQQDPPANGATPAREPQVFYKEPIFPADTSRNLLQSHHFSKPQRFYQYNTLGQPVEMLSAKHYQTVIPDLPQTLSPSGKEPSRYSNVKATVSKTALMGNRPVGKTPSRSQLQHIYNQYKGSQSFTQQNIRPSHYGSYSEGHINVPQGNVQPQAPVERVGGDTIANNQLIPAATKLEPIMHQVGDVPVANKLPGDYSTTPAKNNKLRNGLQDQVFTSYPGSAKWSFHGSTPAPFSVGYRFKTK